MRPIARIVAREPIVTVFIVVALLWGFVVTVLADLAGWDALVAPASIVMLVGAFGWWCRGRDTIEVVAPAAVVAYAAIVGLVIVRLAELHVFGMLENAGLDALWPAILIGGIPFALMSAVFIAMPVSLLPARRQPVSERSQRFWQFIQEQNASHTKTQTAPRPAGSERQPDSDR